MKRTAAQFISVFIVLAISLSVQSQQSSTFPALPEPVSSNAIVKVTYNDKEHLYSFAGITNHTKLATAHHKVWRLTLEDGQTWQTVSSIPLGGKSVGKLASSASSIGENIYLLLGYDITKPTAKKLKSKLYRYHAPDDTYTQLASMPVPVDDTVILPYRDRYLIVVSGWHKNAPINLTQVYDTVKNEWFHATPIPNSGLFGHAAAIIDNTLMVCDGATQAVAPFQFSNITLNPKCYLGEINFLDPTQISWRQWAHPTDEAKFRMVAQADIENEILIFVGGANAIHNFSGTTNNQKAIKTNNEVWVYNLVSQSWKGFDSTHNIFDNKGLIIHNNQWLTVGGLTMTKNTINISNTVINHKPKLIANPN